MKNLLSNLKGSSNFIWTDVILVIGYHKCQQNKSQMFAPERKQPTMSITLFNGAPPTWTIKNWFFSLHISYQNSVSVFLSSTVRAIPSPATSFTRTFELLSYMYNILFFFNFWTHTKFLSLHRLSETSHMA